MIRDPDIVSEHDFRRIRDLVESECGIALVAAKRQMVQTRLRKRASAVGLDSVPAYCEYLFSPAGLAGELPHLIDAVTVNKTDFFREPAHFDYLTGKALPELARMCGAGFRQPLLVWSSACSTGEEPYTLAIVLSEYARAQVPQSYRFLIEATDICTTVLETAERGVYSQETVAPVPVALRNRYLLRSKDKARPLVRIAPQLRALVRFRRQNLIEDDYGFGGALDVVFCRNVMIYFDRPRQRHVLERISRTLRPGGFLIMGHSESLGGLDLPLVQVAPTVYRRPS